jgi:hypothetical protein
MVWVGMSRSRFVGGRNVKVPLKMSHVWASQPEGGGGAGKPLNKLTSDNFITFFGLVSVAMKIIL